MKFNRTQLALFKHVGRCFVAVLCSLMLVPGEAVWAVIPPQDQAAPEAAAKLTPDQLDALVAPIALYPDSLLSQALVASTYPLEIIQLQQWLEKNKGLKDKALTDAAMKQNWDPSVQAMALLPDMVKQLAGNIKWTTDLGNAVLAQQGEVMDAVQRMRGKAEQKGNLKTTEQMKVETKVVENKQVIVIQNSNPEVIYVPSYNPTVVYGAPAYPYPPIAYPPVGYYAAGMALSFGVGMMVGAAWGGGGWGCGWGGGGNNNININTNNNFVNNSNRQNLQGGNRVNAQGGNRVNAQGGNNWQHNPQHRGGAPYGDRGTANKYGGSARGDSPRSSNRGGGSPSAGSMDRGGGNRGGSPSAGSMDRGGGNRGGSPSAGSMDRGSGNRGGSPSAGSMDRGGGGSSRSASSGAGGGGAFGGGSGSSARASSSRGSSSMGGGGGRSGGGGRRR